MNWVQWLILSTSAATACRGETTRPLEAESPCSSDDGSIPASKVPPRAQTDAANALVFTIESIDSPDHNLLRYRLRNVSDEPLWVNGRMLNSSWQREVTIRVTPSISELPIQPDCRIRAGAPEYVRLEPQGEISVVRQFGCLEFPNEGPWRVSAEYHDRSKRIPRPAAGALWFNGTVMSNEIEFSASSTDLFRAGLTAEGVSEFLRELQESVAQRDKAKLSELMHYPLLVSVSGEQQRVSAPGEFVRRYDELMPMLLEQEIVKATPATLFVNSSGIMLGRGQLWSAKVCPDDACTPPVIRVIAISAPIPSN